MITPSQRKSRHVRPERAIPVYVKYAQKEIGRRNRKHYAIAAQFLWEVKQMYQQLDNEDAWDKLITEVREEFKRLPALQDELNRAGL